MSGQEASRSVFQPEVFQVVNSIFRNTWCKPCTIPFCPKTCRQFCFCRNWKNSGFVQGCTVAKARMSITQNLHRKSLGDDVPDRVTQSHNPSAHVAEPQTLLTLQSWETSSCACSTLRLLSKHLQRLHNFHLFCVSLNKYQCTGSRYLPLIKAKSQVSPYTSVSFPQIYLQPFLLSHFKSSPFFLISQTGQKSSHVPTGVWALAHSLNWQKL